MGRREEKVKEKDSNQIWSQEKNLEETYIISLKAQNALKIK